MPVTELERRVRAFQARLQKEGIALSVIRQNADLFYFSGTVQDAHLLIPASSQPVMLVWRSVARARNECPHLLVKNLPGFSSLPRLCRELGISYGACRIGLELDILPASLFMLYSNKIWPQAELVDVSAMIREMRMIKTPWEVGCIEQACAMADHAIDQVQGVLRPGITELQLAAAIEAVMRANGHPGLLRMRAWNQEIGMGQVVSGSAALQPSWTNTPVGGLGPSPAFGMGASHRILEKGDIVSVDLGGWHNGYCSDETRPFSVGPPDRTVHSSFELVLEIMEEMEEMLRPGVIAEELYDKAVEMAARAGVADRFMGLAPEQVSFVGHGLGLELDEYPFISKNSSMVIQPGMVVALEPKIFLEDKGVVGLEDTFLITDNRCRRLTLSSRRLIEA